MLVFFFLFLVADTILSNTFVFPVSQTQNHLYGPQLVPDSLHTRHYQDKRACLVSGHHYMHIDTTLVSKPGPGHNNTGNAGNMVIAT